MTQYRYTPFSGARQIRLLKLHAGADGDDLSLDLVHTALDQAPFFIALSYPWGEPQPQKMIRCSGLLAEIGPNLHSALQHLREPNCDTFVWADALCINQEDIPERTQQVKMMGEIYAAASVTAIWLGEESDEIRMAFGWLRRFEKVWVSPVFDVLVPDDDSGLIPEDLGEEMLKAAFGRYRAAAFEHIWALLDRPWFTRKWVIQELVKSRTPLMVAGRLSRLPWAVLVSWMHFLELCLQAKELFMLCCPHANVLEAGTKILGMNMRRATILSQMKSTKGGAGNLLFLVARTLTFRCADPRDHIFSLIGIASDANRFNRSNLIDYESSIEGIWRHISYTCASDSMSLKLLWSLVPFTPLKHRVRSWLPNLESVLADGDGSIIASQFTVQKNRDHNASGDSVLQASLCNDGDTLAIRGRIVDSLQRAGSDHRSLGNSHTIQSIRVGNGQASRENVQRMLRHKDRWVGECMDIAKTPGGGGGKNAFRDALLDGELTIEEFSQNVKVAKLEFSAQIRLYQAQTYAVDDRSFSAAIRGGFDLKSTPFLDNIMMEKVQRRFGRTEKERLGWFPIVAEEGDLVCIFDGMELPYAIRPAAEGRYHLVGECIIPGIMMGEAVLESPGVDSEMIILE